MPPQKKSTGAGKAAMGKKKTTTRSSNRLTKADLQALGQLDRILEEERRTREKYTLPLGFRVPQQIATSLQQCTYCKKDIALLIFGDNARDIAGLEAYARMMEEPMKRTNLPAYVIGSANRSQFVR
ncbi:MAG: hypothetical protein H0V70_08820 [Ktedonobacteraceae bacterium]|nr:hypothetical protein [Ktedonobacteraceae bacterium]